MPAGWIKILTAGKLLLLDDWLNEFICLGLAARLVFPKNYIVLE